MFLQGIFLAGLAIVEFALCMPLSEEIKPVELKYHCYQVITDDEKSEKNPVLLLHGMSGSHRSWDGTYQVLALRTKRRVCVVDLRNHGDSPWDDRSDIAAMTVDVANFLDKQNIKKVNIIGHSLGGKIGVHYALNNPDRVESLVVEDMRPNGITKEAATIIQSTAVLLQPAIDSVPRGIDEDEAKRSIIKFFIKKTEELGIPQKFDEEESAKSLQIRLVDGKWQWKMNWKVLFKFINDYKNSLTESSGLYEGPTMFIFGAKSPFGVGLDKENILKLFPKAKLVPVEGAIHSIHGKFREFDDEVIKLLNEIK